MRFLTSKPYTFINGKPCQNSLYQQICELSCKEPLVYIRQTPLGNYILINTGNGCSGSQSLLKYLYNFMGISNDAHFYIFLTHSNKYQNGGLEHFTNNSNVSVFISGQDPTFTLGEVPQLSHFSNKNWLHNNQIVNVDGVSLRILNSPGTTPDSICIYDSEDQRIFIGELFYPWIDLYFGRKADFIVYRESLDILLCFILSIIGNRQGSDEENTVYNNNFEENGGLLHLSACHTGGNMSISVVERIKNLCNDIVKNTAAFEGVTFLEGNEYMQFSLDSGVFCFSIETRLLLAARNKLANVDELSTLFSIAL